MSNRLIFNNQNDTVILTSLQKSTTFVAIINAKK
jgi:hypothetical protein